MQGRFLPMHERLIALRGQTTDAAIALVARRIGLDMDQFAADIAGAAKRTVDADLRDAKRLGLSGTPSLLLCTPEGAVYLLRSLDQCGSIVGEWGPDSDPGRHEVQ